MGGDIIENLKNRINYQINIDKHENKYYNVSNIEIFTLENYKRVIKILEKYNKNIEKTERIEDSVSDNEAEYVIIQQEMN